MQPHTPPPTADRQSATAFAYTLYGLTLHSSYALPLWPADPTQPPSLTVTLAGEDALPAPTQRTLRYASPYFTREGENMLTLWEAQPPAPSGYWLRLWVGGPVAEIGVSLDGRQVTVIETPALRLRDLLPYLLGTVIPLVVRLRGMTALHAAVAKVDGGLVALVGNSETGKSTTLTALLQQGATFFSDDLAPLVAMPAGIAAYAGYPRVGLLPDAVRAVLGDAADLPWLWDEGLDRPDKRVYTPSDRLPDPREIAQPCPLAAVYILSPRRADVTAPTLVELTGRAAVAALLPFTTGRMLRTPANHAADLAQLSALMRSARIAEVIRPNDLTQLPAIAALLLADARAAQAARRAPAA